MSICIIQTNHSNERLNAIVNVWIELCQESNHFKIFITIVEFWESVHSRNDSRMFSEQFGMSLWHFRTDLIFRIHDVMFWIEFNSSLAEILSSDWSRSRRGLEFRLIRISLKFWIKIDRDLVEILSQDLLKFRRDLKFILIRISLKS